MKSLRDYRSWAILIFGVAFVIRLIYLLQVRSNPFFYSPMVDELWNLNWATEILEKSFWGSEVYFRGPLYPYLLALILKVTGSDYFWAKFIQMIISSASVSMAYLLGREFFSEKVARLGSVLYAVYGTVIFYEAMFLIPVIFIFLNLLGLIIVARNRDNPHKKPYFLAGVVFGLSAIARPNILLIVPMLALWVFFHFRKKIETRSIVVLLLVFFIGVALPILPVTARNYIVADDPVMISSQGGINLYLGNNTVAEGLTMMMPEIVLDARIPWDRFNPTISEYAEKAVGHPLKPSEVSAFWSNKAKEFVFEHPGQFIGLTFRKLLYFFSGFENSDQTDIYNFTKYSPLISILIFNKILKFPFGLFAPLGLIGIGLCWYRRHELAPLLIFFFGYIPTVILFLVTARHRLTVIPILLLFSAYTIFYLRDRLKASDLKKAARPIAAMIILLAVMNINFFDLGFQNVSQIHYSLALTHTRQGNYEEAIKEHKLAIDKAPAAPALYVGLGTAYYKMQRHQDAIGQFTHALSLDPDYVDAYVGLGITYYEMGQLDRAERALRRAAMLDPDRIEPYINLGEIHMARENHEMARRFFEIALEIDPDDHVLNTKLGVLHGRAGDTVAAYGYFRQSLEINPSYSAGYLNWGNICLINGDTATAMQKYNRAIELDSLALEPYYNLTLLYIKLGNLQKARESINALLRIDPDFEKGLDLKQRLGG
jgi:tetratricopeptide (TPR) repeat protein